MEDVGRVALGGRRYQLYPKTLRFIDVDLTGATFRLQVRLYPNAPGAPLIDLQTVTTAAAQGVRLIYGGTATVAAHVAAGRINRDGVPAGLADADTLTLSLLGIRVNKTTMEGLPYTGEPGEHTQLAYDMQVKPAGGNEQVWIEGEFWALAAVTGADAAPLAYAGGPGASARSPIPGGTTSFRIGDSIIQVTVAAGEGPRGLPSGPLGAGSVDAVTITNSASEQALVREKLGAGSAALLATTSAQAGATAAALPLAPTAVDNVGLTPRPILRPNAAMMSALLSGTLTICVVGDSIQWEGELYPYPNTMAENFQRLLQARFPWLTINVVNLSIPGRSMQNLANSGYTAPGSFTIAALTGINTSYWPGGSVSGKTWRDHVRDAQPDIIVLALGENDGTDELPFSTNYQTFFEYSQTWTKKPWFTLVPSLIPEGTAVERQGKQAIADFLRYKAVEQGFGLIDANALYRLMRDGARRDLAPAVEEVNFAGFADPVKWASTGPTLSGTTVSGAGRVERLVAARDVDISLRFNLAGNDAVWASNFRTRPGGVGGYVVQTAFADQGDGQGGAIRLFYRGSLVAVARVPVRTSGQNVRIRVKAWGPLIRVWHDGTQYLSYSSAQGLYAGVFDIGTAAGSGSHSLFRVSYAPEYAAAQPFFSPAYLLNDNLHHPTSEGAFQTYIPAMARFVEDLAALIERPIVASASDTANVTFATTGSVVLAAPKLTFRLATDRVVPVHVRFGYLNANTGDGTLTLRLDGAGVDTAYLPPAQGNNRRLSYTVHVPMAAGLHTLDLVQTAPAGATTGITSNGGDNTRALSAAVQIV